MAQVIIVSRTKMAGDRVCVGGVDIDNRFSLRLLTARGTHEMACECPYQIWDIWDSSDGCVGNYWVKQD